MRYSSCPSDLSPSSRIHGKHDGRPGRPGGRVQPCRRNRVYCRLVHDYAPFSLFIPHTHTHTPSLSRTSSFCLTRSRTVSTVGWCVSCPCAYFSATSPTFSATANADRTQKPGHPGWSNPKSISHRCYLQEVAFEWELKKLSISPWFASRADFVQRK